MKKKGFWKKAAANIFILVLGIAVGIMIGMPIGRQRAEKEAAGSQGRGTLEPTKTPEELQQGAANTPEPTTGLPDSTTPAPTKEDSLTGTAALLPTNSITEAPTETIIPTSTGGSPAPTAEPGATPQPTAEPGATPEPTGAPELTPEPTGAPKPTPELTGAPEPTPQSTGVPKPTPQPTGVPEPTNRPTVTPKPTLKPTVTPKPTLKPTVTKKPTATPIPAASGENGYYGALHVEGTYLADSKGDMVQLRGISTHGLGWFPEYVNEKAIRQFKEEWGCNVIRLAMYTAEYNGYCTSDAAQKENLKKIVDTGVTAATSHNMYVIIDWHILQDSNPHTNKEEAKKFFAEMAEKYKDNPNVIYEICNEPNGGVSWSEIKRYALEVIPVIRKYAPEAVIIVGTPTWSQDVDIAAANPITEYENIMYALHFYADTHRDGLREKCKTAVKKGLPVFVSEYGICDASGSGAINRTQADLWISMLDSYGISYVAWNLSNKAETSSMIASSCNKKNGFTESDLSEGGKWFVNMLQKAGTGLGSALSGTTEAGQGDTVTGGDSSGSGTSNGNTGGNTDQQTVNYIAYGESILKPDEGLKLTVSNGWNSGSSMGIQLNLTVENMTGGDETDWERKITVKDGVKVEVAQNWNSSVEMKGNTLIIRPAAYNKTITAGASVGDIGVILNVTE